MPLAEKTDKHFTYTDYITWPDEERWELIDGQAYNMTPAPSCTHQKIAGNLYFTFKNRPAEKRCTPFIAPTDVVLSESDIVQPDVFVVCDQNKITEANIQGAPDLVIEVISPVTALKDKREKKALYERFGVREYIIVDPNDLYVERFLLEEDGLYGRGEIFSPREILPVVALEGIEIPLWAVFEVEGPGTETFDKGA